MPEDYQVPVGISSGSDLFVGYLMLDSLTVNPDRHGGNWGYSESIDGNKRLAPIYDNGSSLGLEVSSNPLIKYSPEQFMSRELSRFGESYLETFAQAALLKPDAARIWLDQLEKISTEDVNQIFDQTPGSRITEDARLFAQSLLDYNRSQLLKLKETLNLEAPVVEKRKLLQSRYERYSLSLEERGLLGATEIALRALKNGVARETVLEMLANYNSAYQNLAERSGKETAERVVIERAEVEIWQQQTKQAQFPQTRQSRGRKPGS